MSIRFEPVATAVRPSCRARGCERATSKQKPFCSTHLDRLPYVKAVKAARPGRAASSPPIDGYLRLLERVGLVRIETRGSRRVAVWRGAVSGELKSAS